MNCTIVFILYPYIETMGENQSATLRASYVFGTELIVGEYTEDLMRKFQKVNLVWERKINSHENAEDYT